MAEQSAEGPIFNRVALIGVGLIGGSIARTALARGLCREVYAYSRRAETRAQIRDLGIVHRVCDTLAETVSTADLVILCTPVATYAGISKAIGLHMKRGAILSDVGSVKQRVIDDVAPNLPASVDFVPAHPIAGTENSGPEAGFHGLFDQRWCILTPPADAPIGSVMKVTEFWQGLGSDVEMMTADHHDLVLGMTSHLPHLIAYTVVGTASGLEDSLKSEVIKFSAGGFRDFTRIAASDPVMWRDIFLTNPTAVLDLLNRFEADLGALKTAIEAGNGAALQDWFTRTRAIRRSIVEAGQAGQFDPREAAQHLSEDGFLGMYGS